MQIIDAYLGLMALREAGYRSTATAVAELVDNSLEAKATHIDILTYSKKKMVARQKSNRVEAIAVLDNGDGMSEDVLQKCLSMGWGSRLETREGLGRFGFGLKGSSISQARRVEVYTWQDGKSPRSTYLDLDEIAQAKQQVLPDPADTELPSWVLDSMGSQIGASGTLVLWTSLEGVDIKRPETLVVRINRELCRIYRHFLDDDDDYGTKRHIVVHNYQEEDAGLSYSEALKANDPLYLLSPNNLPGYENESTNVEYENFKVPVSYNLGGSDSVSEVEFRFSIAKPEIQKLGGSSAVGKHYGHNTGISFVRAGREIDFDSFGFLTSVDARHRWWGAEVRFEPVLDELFGLTNNKQSVRSIKKLDEEAYAALDAERDHKTELLLEVNKALDESISAMMAVITNRGAGKRKKKESSSIVKKVNEELNTDSNKTESGDHAANLSEKEKLEERVDLLVNQDETLSLDEAREIATQTIDYKVDLSTGDWPGSLFLDRKSVANASVGVINTRTKFYEKFWHHLEQQDDQKGFEALEVILMALVRAEDELVREGHKEVFSKYRERWGILVDKLIDHAAS